MNPSSAAARPPWPVVLDVPLDDGWVQADPTDSAQDAATATDLVQHVLRHVAVLDPHGAAALAERAVALLAAARGAGAVLVLLHVAALDVPGAGTVLREQHLTLSWYDSAPHPASLDALRAALDDPALRTAGPPERPHLLLPGAEQVHDPATGAPLTVHAVQAWVPLSGTTWTGVVSGSSTLPDGAEGLRRTVERVAASLHRAAPR